MDRRTAVVTIVAGSTFFAGCSALSGGNENQSGGGTDTEASAPSGTDGGTSGGGMAGGGTTAGGAATTAGEQLTTVATATSTPTSGQPMTTGVASTGETTGMAGGTPATPSATVAIDPSDLSTYSSSAYPFSIDYPSSWTVDQRDPTLVKFTPTTPAPAYMLVQSVPGLGSSGLDEAVPAFLRGFKRSTERFTIVERNDVTLPKGNPGRIVDTRLTFSGTSIAARGTFVFTVVDGTLYDALILVSETAYDSTTERAMETIAESFTVTPSASTSGGATENA